MRDFPTKLTPDNISKFKQFRTNRNICKLKQRIYEFLLSDDFINNKNRGFEIMNLGFSKDEIKSVMESLNTLGWETQLGLHDTFLFIYPPNQKPKILQHSFDEFD
jgi:hypothetical protein